MKKLILLFLGLNLISTQSNAQTISWGSPLTVAMGSMYSNVYPRINLVTGNKPLVTWSNSAAAKVYSAVWSGSSFAAPVTVTPAGVTPFAQWWSGAEAASSGDTVFVTFTNEPAMTGHVYTVSSVDGGLTYSDTVRVDNVGTDVPRFPAVAIGVSGNPVINFMRVDMALSTAEYSVSRSLTSGASYLPDVNVSALAAGSVCDCCPGTIVTSGNKHISLYRNNDMNIRTIFASMSTDGSASFPQVSEVDLTNWMVMACPSSGPSGVIVGDTLIYTFRSQNTFRVYIGTVNINDQQIGIFKQISPSSSGMQNYPIVVAKGDTVGVVWQEDVGGAIDVYFSYSFTGINGIGVNVDTLTNVYAGDQTRPDLAYNNKKFHLTYSNAMGTDVKYLVGDVSGGIGITETKNNKQLNFISAIENNGKIEIQIESEKEQSILIQVISENGNVNLYENYLIVPGINKFSIPKNSLSGMQFINLYSKGGSNQSKKIVLSK